MNRFKREVTGLSRHLYAPELNSLTLRSGHEIKVHGVRTIRDAMVALFPKPQPRIVAEVRVTYEQPELAWLNRVYRGVVPNRRRALAFALIERMKLAPGGAVTVKTTLID